MKIAILGMGKSGTTALYAALKAAMPPETVCMFEPRTLRELAYLHGEAKTWGLTKIILAKRVDCGYRPPDFDRNVVIIRDPRDVMVSSYLFRFNRLKLIHRDEKVRPLLEILRRKETDPRSVSFVTLLGAFGASEATKTRRRVVKMNDEVARFAGTTPGSFVYRYEDMTAHVYGEIDAYLGFSIKKPEGLSGWIGRVSRKGESGDWKNWFTEEDVAFFRPLIDPILERFGFDRAWDLADPPRIEPGHCSGYVLRLMAERVNDPSLKKPQAVTVESLRSAASDGKPAAMLKLAEMYLQGGKIEKNEVAAREWLRRAVILGDADAAVRLGRLLFEAGDEAGALATFEEAATLGSKLAHYWPGRLYESRGDHDRSVACYRKGADDDEAASLRGLARAHRLGRGVAVDPEQVPILLQRAADLGNARAAVELAALVESTVGEEAALPCWEKARALGARRALYHLARYHEKRRDYERSLRYHRDGAERGEAACMRGIARAYELGRGVAPDPQKAETWAERARKAAERRRPARAEPPSA